MSQAAPRAATRNAKSSARRVAIGVTGHRPNQLPPADVPRLRGALEDALDRAASASADAGDVSRMTLVSALAEGTDRYAAHAAISRNWELVAPLPFRVDRYLEDFESPDSKSEFRDLLGRATVIEPPGEGGYLAVGEMILDRIDILLALWNGAPPKGPGGTGDVAARALLRGVPVIWLPVEAGPAALIAPERKPRAGTFRARLREALGQRFQVAPQPPSMRLAEA